MVGILEYSTELCSVWQWRNLPNQSVTKIIVPSLRDIVPNRKEIESEIKA